MKKVYIFVLLYCNWSVIFGYVFMNIYVFYFKVIIVINESYDIRFVKFGLDVIFVINWCFEVLKLGFVEVVGCMLVCGEVV